MVLKMSCVATRVLERDNCMIEKIEKWFEPVHNFIINESDNVVFWVAIIAIGLLIYAISYNYFSKD